MKKLYLGITILFSFFIFCFKPSASSDNVLVNFYAFDYDYANPLSDGIHVFNYFEEMNNNSNFYQLLSGLDDSLLNYLSSLNNYEDYLNFDDFVYVYIFTKDEFNYFSNFSNRYSYIDDETEYLILIHTSRNHVYFNLDNGLLNFDYNSDYYSKYVYYKFDSNSNFLGSSILDLYFGNSNDIPSSYYFWNHYHFDYSWDKSLIKNTYKGSNFSLLLSKIYYSSDPISFIESSNLVLSFQYFLTDKALTFNNNYYELSNYGLTYLKDFPLISSKYPFLPYLNMKNYFRDFSFSELPDNYISAEFDLSHDLFLFPISSCSIEDYSLYVYSTEISDFTFYLHTIDLDDKLGYLASYYVEYSFNNKMYLERLNPLYKAYSIDSNELTSFVEDDFIHYYYRFRGSTNKSTYVAYYNPSCYSVSENYSSVSFTNPLTGNSITFSGDSSSTNWKDPTNINSSNSLDFFDIDSASLISNLKSTAVSFVTAGGEIVSLSTLLFNSFPNPVQSLILGAFTITLLIGLLKILKELL